MYFEEGFLEAEYLAMPIIASVRAKFRPIFQALAQESSSKFTSLDFVVREGIPGSLSQYPGYVLDIDCYVAGTRVRSDEEIAHIDVELSYLRTRPRIIANADWHGGENSMTFRDIYDSNTRYPEALEATIAELYDDLPRFIHPFVEAVDPSPPKH